MRFHRTRCVHTLLLLCLVAAASEPVQGFSNHHLTTTTTNFSHKYASTVNPKSLVGNFQAAVARDKAILNLLASKDEAARDVDTEEKSWHPENLVAKLLRNLVLGLTLPFPQLRGLLLRKKKTEGIRIGLGVRECLAFISLYMIVGVLAFSFVFERWSIIDSLYFTCVCFTTVGYGDLCPSTVAGKVFICFFGVAGVAFLGTAIATICSTFVEAEVEAVKRVEDAGKKQILSLFKDMPANLSKFRQSSPSLQQELLEKAEKRKKRRIKIVQTLHSAHWPSVIAQSLPSLSIILGGGAIVGYLNGGWTVLESIYYSIITASTIGFGDLAPSTPNARLFAVLYLPLSVGAAGDIISGIATALLKRRQRKAYESQFEGKLTVEHLRAMDTDGSGSVDKAEYCFFMLKEMGLVSKDDLDELYRQFDALDVAKSGLLDREDLKMMAKLRGVEVLD